MTRAQYNQTVNYMISLASKLTFASDSKHGTKVASEREYWEGRIASLKAEIMALIHRLFPAYDGTVEEFMTANVTLLSSSIW